MSVLTDLSEGLGNVAEVVGPAVVRVEGGRRVPSSGTVWTADGVVVTAEHGIERAEEIRVGLPDGQTVAAALVGRDPTTDVAVLRPQAAGLRPPAWRSLDGVKVGQLALALARPGRTIRARLGIVSALSADVWRGPSGAELDRYLEVDFGTSPGFSGGPLVGVTGQALGMITAGLMRGTALLVPAATLRKVVDALLTHGRIRRGYLGLGAHPVRLPAAVRAQVGQDFGLIVISVEPGSPAERGGLLMGDVIVALDGQPVRHHHDVLGRLAPETVGKALTVRVVRGGVARELTVTVGERP